MNEYLEQIQKLLSEIEQLKQDNQQLIAKKDSLEKEITIYKELVRAKDPLPSLDTIKSVGFEKLVSEFEKGIIIACMNASKGNQTEAAKLCLTTKRIMQYKCEKYNVRAKYDIDDQQQSF